MRSHGLLIAHLVSSRLCEFTGNQRRLRPRTAQPPRAHTPVCLTVCSRVLLFHFLCVLHFARSQADVDQDGALDIDEFTRLITQAAMDADADIPQRMSAVMKQALVSSSAAHISKEIPSEDL